MLGIERRKEFNLDYESLWTASFYTETFPVWRFQFGSRWASSSELLYKDPMKIWINVFFRQINFHKITFKVEKYLKGSETVFCIFGYLSQTIWNGYAQQYNASLQVSYYLSSLWTLRYFDGNFTISSTETMWWEPNSLKVSELNKLKHPNLLLYDQFKLHNWTVLNIFYPWWLFCSFNNFSKGTLYCMYILLYSFWWN